MGISDQVDPMLLELHDLLLSLGADAKEDFKLYRHADHPNAALGEVRIDAIVAAGDLEIYQSVQRNAQLGHGLVAFFAGERGRLSRLLGVWRVEDVKPSDFQSPEAERAREKGYLQPNDCWHVLKRDRRFDPAAGRVVINWPQTGRHHQWLFQGGSLRKSIPIHEVRAAGSTIPFPGFADVCLRYHQLRSLVESDASGWADALSSTRGVYLVTDLDGGDLYVGSATGAGGFWSRWAQYAKSGHGGNKIMIDRVNRIEAYAANLQFTILETMSNLATREDGIRAEVRWKTKLGRKAIILNAN